MTILIILKTKIGSIYIGGIDIDERLDHPTEFVISIQ